jgi:hypothetical protein
MALNVSTKYVNRHDKESHLNRTSDNPKNNKRGSAKKSSIGNLYKWRDRKVGQDESQGEEVEKGDEEEEEEGEEDEEEGEEGEEGDDKEEEEEEGEGEERLQSNGELGISEGLNEGSGVEVKLVEQSLRGAKPIPNPNSFGLLFGSLFIPRGLYFFYQG